MNFWTVLLALVSVSLAVHAADADLILHHGSVITVDPKFSVHEAVAVKDGRIVAVGSETGIMELKGANTRLHDLRGRALLPGFYAAHDHFPSAGVLGLYHLDLNSPPIGSMESIEDIVAALHEKAAHTPAGKWVVGRGYDDTLVRERRHPSRADLDRASTNHPVWIVHTSGHLGVANSRALALAGISKDTPQPKSGVIRKDASSGEPNGVLEECSSLVSRHIPGLTLEQRMDVIRRADRDYLTKGVTTTSVAGGSSASVADLKLALERGLLHLRVVTMLSTGSAVPTNANESKKWGAEPDRLRVGALKTWQDGSIQGFTGYLTQPYHIQPAGQSNYVGYAMRSREELARLVLKYHRAGYQLAIHGNGDAAIDDILEAFAGAQREFPRNDTRHRIEHCQTAREDQLDRMKLLGVTPSFFVGHVYYWGDRHRDIFLGPERAERISPLHSAVDRGLRFTIHNDTPVTPVDPLLLVWAAVTRTTRNGQVLGAEQRVTVEQALRAVTSDAAWQNFDEDSKGSIERGKLADFVVLEANPLTIPPSRLKDIAVLETIISGQSVYRKADLP